MKKVLVITYYWPPGAGPGVQRWLKFCKFLRENDWEPIVLTVSDGSYPSIDKTLVTDIPRDLQVIKTNTFEPFSIYNLLKGNKRKSSSVGMIGFKDDRSLMQRMANYIRANYFIPDARKGWNKYAIKAATKIIQDNSISAVISTGPPHSTHLIARQLKKQFSIAWLADFRDPWVNVYYNKFFPRTKATQEKDQKLETAVLGEADAVSVVSQGLLQEFQDRTKMCKVIYNGFDDSDFGASIPKQDKLKFTIAYIGNFKPNQNVKVLWEVLAMLIRSDDNFKEFLRVRLIGNTDSTVKSDIERLGLTDHVSFESFVDHRTAVGFMRTSSLLLFIIPKVSDNHLILTGKLFEYMASCSRMLSIGPVAGNAAEIIRSCERGDMLDYNDKDGIKDVLRAAMNDWCVNKMSAKHSMNEKLLMYSRKGQTKVLAELLNKISAVDE